MIENLSPLQIGLLACSAALIAWGFGPRALRLAGRIRNRFAGETIPGTLETFERFALTPVGELQEYIVAVRAQLAQLSDEEQRTEALRACDGVDRALAQLQPRQATSVRFVGVERTTAATPPQPDGEV